MTENSIALQCSWQSRFAHMGLVSKLHRRIRARWIFLDKILRDGLQIHAPRVLDLTLSTVLILFLAPALLALAISARAAHGQVFAKHARLGYQRRPFEQLTFAGEGKGRHLASLFNVFLGNMSFVGPLPQELAKSANAPSREAVRYSVRPGVVSLFGLRRKLGIAHAGEADIDCEFVHCHGAFGNLWILARAAVSVLIGKTDNAVVPLSFSIFGIDIRNTTMAEAVAWITERATNKQDTLVTFVNPDCLNIAYGDIDYRRILHHADAVLPDGIGIKVACRMRGIEQMENVNGTDLFPFLCERASETGLSLFLLGSHPGVADLVKREMQDRYPNLRIAGTQHGYFSAEEETRVIDRINQSGADLLLVAMGCPRQEKWLHCHQRNLNARVRIGVGGLFDFYSGRVRRAPIWMRELGLEWVWRLLQEPTRLWRRYVIGNPLFLYRNWKEIRKKTL
ncbi:MAG: WecB/TagA/CpsF family glycosyltransferase [Gammaproteobacteria bacterium]|nr:WecB/TagA/CpsF family glycosyltransferase [Gammaproteobacteria bacterium]MDH3468217.1 WecB/TagA/CpsF family glycosyltransferase [Gammaproteobacteria bacterium]